MNCHKHNGKYDWKELDFFLNNVKKQLNLKKICILKNIFLSNKKFKNYLILHEYLNKKISKLNFDIFSLKFNKNFIIFLADENNIPFYYNNIFVTIQNKTISSNQSDIQNNIYNIYSDYLRNFNTQVKLSQKTLEKLNKTLDRQSLNWRQYTSNKWLLSSIYLSETLYKSSNNNASTLTLATENTVTFSVSNDSLIYQIFNNNGYSAYVFYSGSATLTFPAGTVIPDIPSSAQSLFVAGGGSSSTTASGSSGGGGGGGGGGFVYTPLSNYFVDFPNYVGGILTTDVAFLISIGKGGAALQINSSPSSGINGGNTTFGSLVCYGGQGSIYDNNVAYGGTGGGTNLNPTENEYITGVGFGGDGGSYNSPNSTSGGDATLNGVSSIYIPVPFYTTNPTNIHISGGGGAAFFQDERLNLGVGGNGYGGELVSIGIDSYVYPYTYPYPYNGSSKYPGYAYGGGGGSAYFLFTREFYFGGKYTSYISIPGSGAPGVGMIWFSNTLT